jgi:phage-related protein
MKNYLGTSTGTYGPTMTSALGGMQGAMNAGFLLVKGDWQGALDAISGALSLWGTAAKGIMDSIMGQLKSAVDLGVAAIKGVFDGLVGAAQGALGTIQGLFNQAQSLVTQLGQGIVQTTAPAMNTFQSLFDQAATGVVGAATDLYDWLVGGSIWPDMFGTMKSITSTSMASIESTVTSGFASTIASAKASLAQLQAIQQRAAAAMMITPTAANIQATYAAQQAVQAAQAATAWKAPNVPAGAGTIPAGAGLEYVKAWEEAPGNQSAFWVPETPQNLTGGDLASYAQSLADAIQASRVTNATLPVSVVIDGVTVSRVVEERMISQRQIGGGY